jgi:protein-S-isoprenylcysteine O-methyltransferase Ste14
MTDTQTTASHHPDIILKPPYIFGCVFLMALLLEAFWGGDVFSWGMQFFMGCILLAAGSIILALCFMRFAEAKTNISVHQPATALVTTGLYRFSRNPIYIGLFLIYTGLCILLDVVWGYALLVPLFYVMNRFVITPEEEYLGRIFSETYQDYKTRVRRWL